MNKTPCILLFLLLIFSSCEKIKPEKTNNTIVQNTIESGTLNKNLNYKACGIIACQYRDNLAELGLEGKLKLPDLKYYKDRFSILADRYKNINELLESIEFEKFVEDINIDFFSCKGDYKLCEPKDRKYSQDEMNYLFNVFIPDLVINQYKNTKGVSDNEIETIIQSIKRKDFVIDDIKNSLITKYEKDLLEKINRLDFSYIDKDRLKKDDKYFNDVILSPGSGIYDKLIYESQNINISWQSEDQMAEIIESTIEIFYKELSKLGIPKAYFEKKVDINKVIRSLKQNIDSMNKKYKLSEKIPNNRFYRNDELHIFNEKNIKDFELTTFGNDKTFKKSVLKIRHDTYLLFLLGKDENLFFLPNRLNKLNFDNQFILTNIFEYSKHINTNILY